MCRLQSLKDWQVALAMTVALRVFYSALAAALSFHLHLDPAVIRTNAFTENLPAPGSLYYALLGVWERFDTLWYLQIVQHGYDPPMVPIFYPLYPAAIRVVSQAMPAMTAALLISTVAAFFFSLGLLRLAADALPGTRKHYVLLMVSVWPTSFILFAGYAESLTLALVVWAVIGARENRWWLAGLCGMLAGLGRPSGVLVAIPLFLLGARTRRAASLPVLLTPFGVLAYWAWLRWSGHLSVIAAYRLHQGMTLVPPWQGLGEALRLIVSRGDILLAIKLGCVAVFAILSLCREVRLEDKLFSLAVLLQMLMYTGRPLLGVMRYLLLVYPVFIVLANYAGQRNWKMVSLWVVPVGLLNLVWMWAFLNWSLVL